MYSFRRIAAIGRPADRCGRRTDGHGSNFANVRHRFPIASPGPSKRKVTGSLAELWDKAGDLLRAAGAIVFVGYRFPPSDSYARQFLLSAIARNTADTISIHTVLGQETQSPAARRLQGLLHYVGVPWLKARQLRPGFRTDRMFSSLSVHPLFAQDFLDLYDPERLGVPASEQL